MAVSGNGFPVSPNPAELGIETMTIGGASFQVRGGKVRQALEYVATQVHNRVEKANPIYGCYGYSYRMNVNSPGSWSNHASGTAIDYNASRHGNGIPTAATFTAAQIAEIHQILAEVNGVVRWGGDYNGIPDAMHFEIDVGPEALDVVIDENAIPDNGEIASIGAPTLADPAKIPYITANSVSYPTMMNYGHGYAQWKFNPTQSGFISIDVLLSHYSDTSITRSPEPLNLYIFEVAYDSAGGIVPKYATEVAAGPSKQMSVPVEAGKQYVIRVTCTPDYPWIRAVVRIGDYARVSDWITPPEVEAIVTLGSLTFQQNKSLYYSADINNDGSSDDWYLEGGNPGWLYNGMDPGPRFKTKYSISTSGFGQAPWSVAAGTDAMECAWRWARRYTDSQKWAPSDGISWYGVPEEELDFTTHIFPANGAGSASCWMNIDLEQFTAATYSLSSPIGVRYNATPPLTSWDGNAHRAALFGSLTIGSVSWEAYGGSIHVDFDAIRASAGVSGWGGVWMGPSWSGQPGEGYRPDYMDEEIFTNDATSATVEWEEPEKHAEIVNVEWALDEWVTATYNAESGYDYAYPTDHKVGGGSVAEWFVQRIASDEVVEGATSDDWIQPTTHPYGHWGPWGNNGWYYRAAGDGPGSFRATAQHLTTTGGGTTSPWTRLDSSYWSMANDRVVDYAEVFADGWQETWLSTRPTTPAQVRFVVLPRAVFSDSMPFTPPSGYGGDDSNGDPTDGIVMEDYLQGQSIALRVTVQPGRYRIVYPADVPDTDWSGGPEINLAPDDTGRVLY